MKLTGELKEKVEKAENTAEAKDIIAEAGANILTINQNIPINGLANVTISIETNSMESDFLCDSV